LLQEQEGSIEDDAITSDSRSSASVHEAVVKRKTMEDAVCEETRLKKKLTENGDREGNTDKVRKRKEANI
jgi:hypothetical protein